MIKPALPEEVLNWLYFAEEDLESAKIMMREKIYNKVCFHSQQAAEKGLKAFMLKQGLELKKTHKLIDLLSECAGGDGSFSPFSSQAGLLDRFYIPTRYPDALVGSLPEGLPKIAQAEEAIKSAISILGFVKVKLGIN